MKIYAAIGHFKGSKNITSVVYNQNTKNDFMKDLHANDFVAYVVMTEKVLDKVLSGDCFSIYEQVKKMTSNYRVWNEVTDYIEQCADILDSKRNAARAQ